MRVNISCVARACLLTRRIAAGTEDRCCSSLGWPLCAVCVCDRFWLGGATRLRAFCRCGLVGWVSSCCATLVSLAALH